MDQRKMVGQLGEEAATNYLKEQGYQILTRNWSTRLGELDIIAQKGEELVFVEVRSTRSIRFGYGFQSVDVRKQQKIKRLALQYIKQHQLCSKAMRFDVISILLSRYNEVVQLDHIPYAF